MSGRLHGGVLVAPVAAGPDPHPALDRIELVSPMVGLWRADVAPGRIVQAGESIGVLTVLGVVHGVVAGPGARGAVLRTDASGRERAVGFGESLVTLDRGAAESELHATADDDAAQAATGDLTIRAPSSGRFYGRPGPGKPAFVAVGDVIKPGQTVGLLEVMKSFHRVTAGDELPAGARVTAIVVADDADVDAGAELVRLEVAP